MSTFLGILSGIVMASGVLAAIVWQAIGTARDRRTMQNGSLVRRDVETVLRQHGWYVVHSESAYDMQLTLF